MTTKIALIKTTNGDHELHIAGCADLKKSNKQRETEQVFEGADLVEAIKLADQDMAEWFGCDAYTEKSRTDGCWTTVATKQASCFTKAVRDQRIVFGEDDSPSFAATPSRTQKVSAAMAAAVDASLPCTGKWSKCGGKNTSISATWRICRECTAARKAAMAK